MSKYICLILLSVFCLSAFSQKNLISGKIAESNGEPVPFATVKIKSSKTETLANDLGDFYIKANSGDTLIISAINFKQQEILLAEILLLNVVLIRNENSLPAVIVSTAFDIKKEQRTAPYAAQVIPSEVINLIPQTNLNDALAGKIAGVQFRSQSGAKLNSQAFARVRG
ncbi:MAG: carboxypeptidase-like regulatory domain-containing protein, partial [Panacibacter sp.]